MHINNKLLLLTLVGMSLLASCSHKRSESDAKRKAPKAVPDSTIYARLNSIDGDTISITMINHDKSFRFSMAESKHKGTVFGDLNVGDTVAIMARKTEKKVISAVNISQITGLWLIEGGNGDGLRLTSDGEASWIGEKDVTLRSWYIHNGMFIMNYVKADGSDYRERPDTAKIELLDKENFVVEFKDNTLHLKRSKGLITIDDVNGNNRDS